MDSENKSVELWVKCLAWAEVHWRKLLLGVAVLALVALVASFLSYTSRQNAVRASQALSALRPTPNPGGAVTPVPAEAFMQIVADFPGTEASARALLLAGGAFFDNGNFTSALTQFDRLQREFPGSSLRPEALYGQGVSLEALGRLPDAGVALQALLSRYPTSSLVPRAKLALARVQMAQQQPETALRLLEEVSRAQPYGLLGMLAEILQDEIKAAHPSLSPPPAAATNVINILPAPAPGPATNSP